MDKIMDKTMDKITNQITMLGTGNATISQINTDFLFGYLGILLPIMARMNLCKSVESVGHKKSGFSPRPNRESFRFNSVRNPKVKSGEEW